MAFADELAGAKSLIGRAERIGENALTRAEVLSLNPEADDIATDVARLAGYNLKPGTLTGFGAALKAALSLFEPVQPAVLHAPLA